MNRLITAALNNETFEPLLLIPTRLLDDEEQAILAWIAKFQRQHEKLPSVERLERAFPNFVPVYANGEDPMSDIVEQTLAEKRRTFASSTLAMIDEDLTSGKDIPIEKLIDMVTTLSMTSGGLVTYHDFDRSEYFRTGTGLPFGFNLIDRVTGGLMRGDYALISGRLGTGKTTITAWICHLWRTQGRRILFASGESTYIDTFLREDAMVGNFNPLRVRTQEDLPALKKQLISIKTKTANDRGEIIVPRSRIATPGQLGAIAKFLKIDAIIVDGVYLMQSDTPIMAKWERVAAVSNALKQLAIDLQLPILGVTQIKRVGDKDDYDPEDLAFSDALGQDADQILALHADPNEPNAVDIQLIKNRYGARIDTRARIDFDTMTVKEELLMPGADAEEIEWTKGQQ